MSRMIADEVLAQIKPGATVRVFESVQEGDKTRLSQFEGLVLARKHGSEAGAAFTVRRVLAGVGVEKVYPIRAPIIARVVVLQSPKKVHRAKLYYLRTRSRKEVRQKTRTASEKSAA